MGIVGKSEVHETCDKCNTTFVLGKGDNFLGVLDPSKDNKECSPFVNLDALCEDCYKKTKNS